MAYAKSLSDSLRKQFPYTEKSVHDFTWFISNDPYVEENYQIEKLVSSKKQVALVVGPGRVWSYIETFRKLGIKAVIMVDIRDENLTFFDKLYNEDLGNSKYSSWSDFFNNGTWSSVLNSTTNQIRRGSISSGHMGRLKNIFRYEACRRFRMNESNNFLNDRKIYNNFQNDLKNMDIIPCRFNILHEENILKLNNILSQQNSIISIVNVTNVHEKEWDTGQVLCKNLSSLPRHDNCKVFFSFFYDCRNLSYAPITFTKFKNAKSKMNKKSTKSYVSLSLPKSFESYYDIDLNKGITTKNLTSPLGNILCPESSLASKRKGQKSITHILKEKYRLQDISEKVRLCMDHLDFSDLYDQPSFQQLATDRDCLNNLLEKMSYHLNVYDKIRFIKCIEIETGKLEGSLIPSELQQKYQESMKADGITQKITARNLINKISYYPSPYPYLYFASQTITPHVRQYVKDKRLTIISHENSGLIDYILEQVARKKCFNISSDQINLELRYHIQKLLKQRLLTSRSIEFHLSRNRAKYNR